MVNWLHKAGHDVFEEILSEHLPDISLVSGHQIKEWYKKWTSYVSARDCMVVEGSYPSSIHVGFEVGEILSRNKPVVLLYEDDRNPIFVNELYSPRLIKSSYTKETIGETLSWCLEELEHVMSRRFTFFVSAEINTFLDTIAKQQGVSRSEYIRMLIERQMENRINKK